MHTAPSASQKAELCQPLTKTHTLGFRQSSFLCLGKKSAQKQRGSRVLEDRGLGVRKIRWPSIERLSRMEGLLPIYKLAQD